MTLPSRRTSKRRRRCSSRSSKWLWPEIGKGLEKGAGLQRQALQIGRRALQLGAGGGPEGGICHGRPSPSAFRSKFDCPLVARGFHLKTTPTPDACSQCFRGPVRLLTGQLSAGSPIFCPVHQEGEHLQHFRYWIHSFSRLLAQGHHSPKPSGFYIFRPRI